jgi:carbamoyl-phosphate synthase large subunit
MAETPYHIVGVDMSPTSEGLFSSDSSYLVPPASSPYYVGVLKKICLKEKVAILIPGSDPELLEVSRKKDQFSSIGVKSIVNPPEVIEICADKWKTAEFLKSNHFNCPQTVLIENDRDLSKIDFYPVIIKPARSSSGSQNVFLAQTQEEASFFSHYLVRQGHTPLVQEHIGSYDAEYTVGVLTLDDGQLVGSIALRRIITSGLSKKIQVKSYKGSGNYIVSSGISQGEVRDFSDVRKYSESIAKKLGVHGPVNIQGRKTEKGFYPFEINARFSGTTSVRVLLGYNEPDILVRYYVLGEKPKKIHFKKGFVARGLSEHYVPFERMKRLKKAYK